jgi:hypothetical protein
MDDPGPQPHAQQQQQGAPAQEHHHRTLSHPSHPYEQPSQQERRIQALKAKQERLEEEIEKLKYDLEHERDEDITHAQPTEKPAGRLLLGLDVGTTGAKAFIYDERCTTHHTTHTCAAVDTHRVVLTRVHVRDRVAAQRELHCRLLQRADAHP